MRRALRICAMLLCALAAASCHYKELCMVHWEHASHYQVDVRADYECEWEYSEPELRWQTSWPGLELDMSYDSLCPAEPEGLRAVVYYYGGESEIRNIDAHGGIVPLGEGTQSIIFFNNDTEYIVFNDMGKSANASATTRTRSRASYKGSPFSKAETEEDTVNPPDQLYGHYENEYTAQKLPEAPILGITMRPLVFTYLIRCHFDRGAEHVALVRGALAGMAGSVYLTDGHTGPEVVTVLFDGEMDEKGYAIAQVKSFGAPDYPNPNYYKGEGDASYGLNIELRLKNGKIKSFDFDISSQMLTQPRGGVIEVDGLYVDEEEAKEASGSFDVDVSDWGDFVDVPIVM